MQDVLLIVLFILYLVVGSSGKKKHNNKRQDPFRRGPVMTRVQGEHMDATAMRRDRQMKAGFGEAFDAFHEEKSCEGERIHLHEVSQQDMLAAEEGEDPCHVGDSALQQDTFDAMLEADNQAQQRLREDVLRGVIMREILTRPHERRLRQRKEYHG